MKKYILRFAFLSLICGAAIIFATPVLAYQNPTANAGPDLYVNSGQTIVLQGSGYDPQNSNLTFYWNCNGGTLSAYSVIQPTYTAPNNFQTNYTCTLTVTNTFGLSATDTMLVYINSSNTNTTTLTTSKQIINLTSGNLNWQSSINARQGDILSFAITMQSGNQDIHNVIVKDILPAGLIYKGNLTVNASLNYGGSLSNGINIGTISANGIAVIAYQAQVVNYGSYISNVLTNNAIVTSTEVGTQTVSASVTITNPVVLGATTISTGATNNLITESYLLPMFLITLMSWLYFTGRIYQFADWLKQKI
jgi:uncharacterized repeat protein (TIGR01451 family)